MSSSHTALVILNYNGKSYLQKFIPSVIRYTPQSVQIVVGDNNSSDDSVKFLSEHYPSIKIIKLNENLGFAEGYNQVLKQVKSDYYFLLNSDVELKEPWQPLIDYLENNPLVAAVQPKILSQASPEYFEHAGAAGGWIDALGYPFCKGRVLSNFEKDSGQYDTTSEIFWASGAAMMVRADLFHDLGGFDGDYFAHMEEIDWCWRAKKSGWKIMSLPQVKVYHIGGGTLPYNSKRKIFLNFRNNIATIIKNESFSNMMWIAPIRLVLDFIALIQFLFKGQFKGAGAVIQAYLYIIKWLPSLYKKRKHINILSSNKIFDTGGRLSGSLIYNYFILGKKTFNALIK